MSKLFVASVGLDWLTQCLFPCEILTLEKLSHIFYLNHTIDVETVVLLFEVIAVEEPVDNAELCDPVVVGVEVDGFVVFIKCGVKVDEAVPGAVGVVDAELLVCIKYGVEADV